MHHRTLAPVAICAQVKSCDTLIIIIIIGWKAVQRCKLQAGICLPWLRTDLNSALCSSVSNDLLVPCFFVKVFVGFYSQAEIPNTAISLLLRSSIDAVFFFQLFDLTVQSNLNITNTDIAEWVKFFSTILALDEHVLTMNIEYKEGCVRWDFVRTRFDCVENGRLRLLLIVEHIPMAAYYPHTEGSVLVCLFLF